MDTIRLGERRFAVHSAALTCRPIPDGTLELHLSVRGEPGHDWPSPHFRLDFIRVTGRSLDEIAGQGTELARGVRPDPVDPRGENLIAALYVFSHLEATANRITWVKRSTTGFEVAWSGCVPDPDRYDIDAPQTFEVHVDAAVEQLAFEPVRGGLCYAEDKEATVVRAVMDELIPALAADLTGRDWFAHRPFSALDLIVQVDAARRRWPAPPPRLRDYAEGVALQVDSKLLGRAHAVELRASLDRQVADALARLEARHPGATQPTFLR